jgi:ureidoglycolate lyase
MKIDIQDVTAQNFAPFGRVIEKPARASDASGPGWQWWGELVNLEGGDRPYAIGYLDLQPGDLRFDWAERHMHTDELVAPLGGDCLVYVAPADHPEEPGRLPGFDRFQVFRVRQGQAVLFGKGVWHGAPLSDGTPLNVLVILLQNSGKQDGYVCRFEESPIEIQP